MNYPTRVSIIRNYKLPEDIVDFLKENGTPESDNRWYSENGELKIK